MRQPCVTSERGSVTAELAIVTPAVLALIGLLAAGLGLVATQARLDAAVHAATRWLSSGNSDSAVRALRSSLSGMKWGLSAGVSTEGSVRCLSAATTAGMPPLTIPLSSRECVDVPPPV